MGFWGSLWNGIKSVGRAVVNTVSTVVKTVTNVVVKAVQVTTNVVKKVVKAVKNVVTTVGKGISWVCQKVKKVTDFIMDNPIVNGLKRIYNYIKDQTFIGKGLKFVGDLIDRTKKYFFQQTWLGRKIDQGLNWLGNTAIGKFCKQYALPVLNVTGTILSICGIPAGKIIEAGCSLFSNPISILNRYIPSLGNNIISNGYKKLKQYGQQKLGILKDKLFQSSIFQKSIDLKNKFQQKYNTIKNKIIQSPTFQKFVDLKNKLQQKYIQFNNKILNFKNKGLNIYNKTKKIIQDSKIYKIYKNQTERNIFLQNNPLFKKIYESYSTTKSFISKRLSTIGNFLYEKFPIYHYNTQKIIQKLMNKIKQTQLVKKLISKIQYSNLYRKSRKILNLSGKVGYFVVSNIAKISDKCLSYSSKYLYFKNKLVDTINKIIEKKNNFYDYYKKKIFENQILKNSRIQQKHLQNVDSTQCILSYSQKKKRNNIKFGSSIIQNVKQLGFKIVKQTQKFQQSLNKKIIQNQIQIKGIKFNRNSKQYEQSNQNSIDGVLTVRNRRKNSINFEILDGQMFGCKDKKMQHIVCAGTKVEIQPQTTKQIPLKGWCADLSRKWPHNHTNYTMTNLLMSDFKENQKQIWNYFSY